MNMSGIGNSFRCSNALKACGFLGTLLATFLVMVLVPDLFTESSNEFMGQRHALSPRRLQNLTYKGPGFVRHQTKYKDLMDEVFDFHGNQRTVCTEYKGVDHPNERGCCPESCGREFCGTDKCWRGPGGAAACCESEMPHKWCGPNQMAPCMINATYLDKAFDDKTCLAYGGIESPDRIACCPSTCGEYCGADYCSAFDPVKALNGLDVHTQCCTKGKDYVAKCGAGTKAPCLLVVTTTTTSTTSSTSTSTTATTEAAPRLHYSLVGYSAPDEKITIPSEYSGGRPVRFTIQPRLPTGLALNEETGEVHGVLGYVSNTSKQTYIITASNAVGKANSTLSLPKAMDLIYPDVLEVVQGDKIQLSPKYVRDLPATFTMPKGLPKGLEINSKTGEIHGVVSKNAALSLHTHLVVATSERGEVASEVEYSVKKLVEPFNIWPIVIISLLLLCVVVWLCCRKKEEPMAREPSYVPLPPVPEPVPEPVAEAPVVAAPEPEPPKGFPLTFDTGDGETTVYAMHKPLGLDFNKELPIQVSADKEGHGHEIGVKKGWILKSVNTRDISRCTEYQEALDIIHEEIVKLPGGIPLTWIMTDGRETTVWATQRPLGLKYLKSLPIKINEQGDIGGEDLGVEVGWILKAVNYIDVSEKTKFQEVADILKKEVNKLPRASQIINGGIKNAF
jgi:hypothetical protein